MLYSGAQMLEPFEIGTCISLEKQFEIIFRKYFKKILGIRVYDKNHSEKAVEATF